MTSEKSTPSARRAPINIFPQEMTCPIESSIPPPPQKKEKGEKRKYPSRDLLGKRRAEGGKEQQIDDARAISEVTSLPIPPPKKNILFSFSAGLFIFHVWETGGGAFFFRKEKSIFPLRYFSSRLDPRYCSCSKWRRGAKGGRNKSARPTFGRSFFKTEM